ncbi:hypothetical protein KEJ17_07205 [Candidatus Bathyarchaeota archaeon]|nr:hypothetical protein [Candidatus Bathyarchaeota archaeon]
MAFTSRLSRVEELFEERKEWKTTWISEEFLGVPKINYDELIRRLKEIIRKARTCRDAHEPNV